MFVYYVTQKTVQEKLGKPTLTGLTINELKTLKLDYLGKVSTRQILRGPDEGSGWLLYRDVPNQIDSFDSLSQTWQPMPYPNDVWIGYSSSSGKPRPTSLARETQLSGNHVILGDGNAWHIPAACQWDDDLARDCTLPRSLGVDSDGQWILGDVIPTYARLWSMLGEFLTAQSSADRNGKFSFPGINEWCSLALSANYFVGPSEVTILQLLNQETRKAIIRVLTDMETFENVLEKKSASLGIGSTSPGPDVSTQEPEVNIALQMPIGSLTN